MLSIRFKRIGRRHQPSYRIVVSERRSRLNGLPIEDLGPYSPFSKEAKINKERTLHWISVGAQPTASVHNLLVRENIIEGAKIAIPLRKKKSAVASDEASPEKKDVVTPDSPSPKVADKTDEKTNDKSSFVEATTGKEEKKEITAEQEGEAIPQEETEKASPGAQKDSPQNVSEAEKNTTTNEDGGKE